MRIIAGQRRGHKIDGPEGREARPTSDFVREAMFNILGVAVDGLVVIDLFAGTGALGLEALSRGASRAIFVELKRQNAALIRRNIATLRYEDRATVLTADVYRWARGYVAVDPEPVVVFLDPPYLEFENHPERVKSLLAGLIEKLPHGSILIVESGRMDESELLPDHEAWDVRRYGKTRVALLTTGPAEDEGEGDLLAAEGGESAPDGDA